MTRLFNSFRFQIFGILLLVAVLLAASIFQNFRALSQLSELDEVQHIADDQRSQAYLLSSLSRRLFSTSGEAEIVSLTQLIVDTTGNVEGAFSTLGESDVLVDNPELVPLLDSVNANWTSYIADINSFIDSDNATRADLIGQIEADSVTVFIFTDRLATGIEEIADNQSAVIQQITLGIAIALAVVLAIAIVIVLRSVGAITQLGSTLSAYGQGDKFARANTRSLNEVAQVASVFNSVADELNATISGLEQRIAERTADMEKARDEAQASARLANENSRLKSEFLSMMSHELRTPMNAIEGFTGIMLEHMGGVEFNDKAEDYLNKIEWNSHRLLGLINDFLDLSRIESGRLELVYRPISLSDMAQIWRDNFSVLADNKGLSFEVTVDPNVPDIFYGDEESLSKIAINLLGNAAKFTESGTIALKLEKRGEMIALEVSDTGIGIPPHAREFVFDEFRQVDQSSTREHGGTGLGLSIVQKLVRAMGGQITLDSEVGVSSTFTVLLPIRIEEQFVQGIAS